MTSHRAANARSHISGAGLWEYPCKMAAASVWLFSSFDVRLYAVQVPVWLEDLGNLLYLDLAENLLTKLPPSITGLTMLRKLNICNQRTPGRLETEVICHPTVSCPVPPWSTHCAALWEKMPTTSRIGTLERVTPAESAVGRHKSGRSHRPVRASHCTLIWRSCEGLRRSRSPATPSRTAPPSLLPSP